ncbi:hypothetical protein TIFTF001_000152 [Ficus carica]|uniref:Uncharacterized protein n=1 Tax=Ficus carica TaxID=3494 RepID=A0AA88CNJ5_FICCA|nr:hypothetical protein TIFTF001_000152 [Ficus carica]
MGREGGGKDLNLGTPQPVRSAMRSESPPRRVSAAAPSSPPEARRSEKEVVMKGWEGKVKLGYEFAEVSKLPDEEAMKEERERRERKRVGFFGNRGEKERDEYEYEEGEREVGENGREDGHVLPKPKGLSIVGAFSEASCGGLTVENIFCPSYY